MLKGIRVNVLEDKLIGNCSNGGLTERHESFVLCGEELPEVFTANAKTPALILRKGPYGHWIAEPPFDPNFDTKPNWDTDDKYVGWMFGGTFVWTCDSRFRAICEYPIPVHDRRETYKEYKKMTM